MNVYSFFSNSLEVPSFVYLIKGYSTEDPLLVSERCQLFICSYFDSDLRI